MKRPVGQVALPAIGKSFTKEMLEAILKDIPKGSQVGMQLKGKFDYTTDDLFLLGWGPTPK